MKKTLSTTLILILFHTLYINAQEQKNAMSAQGELPLMKSTVEAVSIREGNLTKANYWSLVPEAKPDIYEVSIYDRKTTEVSFISDVDSLTFTINEGSSIDFIIRWDDKDCHQRIIGKKFIPAANFTPEYQRSNRGKISIRVPQVYEMVNAAMAVSQFGRSNPNRIYQHSEYHKKVLDWFTPYETEEFVKVIDSVMAQNSFNYAPLKMNANAFYFDEDGIITRSEIFDRTGFYNQKTNYLVPFMPAMQHFADQSRFLDFYEENKHVYDAQIGVFRDSLDLPGMQTWLEERFPGASGYDHYHVVFSPLVSYHQSATWFESNGFKELQPHVNFPYKRDLRRLIPISDAAAYAYRGNIVFTELNHGYINPVSDRHHAHIMKATSNRGHWVDKDKGGNYYTGITLFNEYMNWGLVNLRIMDIVPEEEQEKLIARVDRMMVRNRGFTQFDSFSPFLRELYANKQAHENLIDLYPEIIRWFEEHNPKEKSPTE